MRDRVEEDQDRGTFLILEGKIGDRFYLLDSATYIQIGYVNVTRSGQVRVRLCFPKSSGWVEREERYLEKLDRGEIRDDQRPYDD